MLNIDDKSISKTLRRLKLKTLAPGKLSTPNAQSIRPRSFRYPMDNALGHAVLCDFGEARIGSKHQHKDIQPEIYKAPEVVMETGWGHAVDIWNVGVMVCADRIVWSFESTHEIIEGCLLN